MGVIRLFRWSLLLAIPFLLLFPAVSNLERSDLDDAFTFIAIGLACLIRAALGANLFTPVFMLINGSAPQRALGAVNGFAQTQAAFWRALGPLIGGGVWSLSLGWSGAWADVHHWAPYAVVAALTGFTYLVSLMLRKKVNEDDPDEGEGGLIGGGRRSGGDSGAGRHQHAVVHME